MLGSDFSHVYRAMQIMARFGSRVDWTRFISRKYNLGEVETALRDVEARRVVRRSSYRMAK
jgi:L-iditol 2-dehydrogenase